MDLFAAIKKGKTQKIFVFSRAFLGLIAVLTFVSCADIQKPKIQEYYSAKIEAPKKQEFRWSNGKLPKQLDPALASAPPETDLVRAVYEGLTDLDAKTLKPAAAIAEKWDVSEDGRTWTFHLRNNAKWSNGEPVTARDFARSWRRLAEMGASVQHSSLLKNIVGAENFSINDGIAVLPAEEFETLAPENTPDIFSPDHSSETVPPSPAGEQDKVPSDTDLQGPPLTIPVAPKPSPSPKPPVKPGVQKWFGVEAVGDHTLRVFLIQPDKDFPSVVAHPLFRPIYEGAVNLDSLAGAAKAVTNGAFGITSVTKDEIALARSETYWDKEKVGLESARMIAKPDGETALAAYQANEIDAITNTHFEPLALKLLTPYQDFKRTTHNAVTFYEFNTASKPFNDVRVREALAMALQRERLVQDVMDSAAEAALDFLPFENIESDKVVEGVESAKTLLAEAGYADIASFPKVRLLINRNDLQRRIARQVEKMWLKNLGIQTEIIIKDRAEYEEAISNGAYDLVRRGVVLPTTNETVSLLALFDEMPADPPLTKDQPPVTTSERGDTVIRKVETFDTEPGVGPARGSGVADAAEEKRPESATAAQQKLLILTEREAMERMPAIPLYFPISYSLVKPYISGFDRNLLDAPSLKTVVINDAWKNSPPQK